MNKTKIDLDNDLILRSENIEYNNDTLKNILDNLIFEDVTSQFTFTACTLDKGKIFRLGKIIFINIGVTPTITGGWDTIIKIPNKFFPIYVAKSEKGSPIIGSSFWVYGEGTGAIRGEVQSGTYKAICGYYILQN